MPVFADPEIYRIVLERMQTGLYMVDCDQRIRFWNEGAEKITGYFRQDVVGHFCRDFFPPQKEEGKDGVCEIGGALASVLRDGLMALETDSDNPEQSTIFSKYPKFLKDHHALAFVCDSIRMASSGGIEPFDADQMIENDMDVHHQEATMPITALSTVADSLPGLGIVAAVLGVVIMMGSLGGPPEEIGKKVAAALVGTFLGILLCYGLVGPLASSMSKSVDDEHAYYQVLRVMIVAFMKGTAPTMAVEIGRRAIPGNVRPAFQEAEAYIKDKGGVPAAAAA
jgi:chemotaxis protein MotA